MLSSRPGRPKEDNRARWLHPKFLRQSGIGEGENKATLQHFLLFLHPSNARPQVSRENSTTKFTQNAALFLANRNLPLEIAQVVFVDKARTIEDSRLILALRNENGEFGEP
jgi:hypothetical protein